MVIDPTDGSNTLRIRDAEELRPWRDLVTWPAEESGEALFFAKDGKSIYVKVCVMCCKPNIASLIRARLQHSGLAAGTSAEGSHHELRHTKVMHHLPWQHGQLALGWRHTGCMCVQLAAARLPSRGITCCC